jgi:dTDP-4-amino-4,6-dideoxygalactose transaminase
VPADCGSNHHLFHILLADLDTRTALLDHLKRAGILAAFHYVPLHTSPVGMRFGYRAGMLPITEAVSDRQVRLPFYAGMSEADISTVVGEIEKFLLR